MRARVATKPPPAPPQASWEALASPAYQEAGGEFLLPTAALPEDPIVEELCASVRSASTPLDCLTLVSELVPDRFEYRQGATYVDSTLEDLLAAGAGVCQDFVHLTLALLRSQGIATRYVSGYLFADGQRGSMNESVEVDTHAWVEALLPNPDGGEPVWVAADPTNRGLVGEDHVKIGHGRHYADVAPIKGVYRGGAKAGLSARVTMTRLDQLDPASIARA